MTLADRRARTVAPLISRRGIRDRANSATGAKSRWHSTKSAVSRLKRFMTAWYLAPCQEGRMSC